MGIVLKEPKKASLLAPFSPACIEITQDCPGELAFEILIQGWWFSCQVVSDSFVTPWTVACQAPLSMGFPRQECQSGFPCPPPGDLPQPGIEPGSLTSPALADRLFTTEPSGKPYITLHMFIKMTYIWWNFRHASSQVTDRGNFAQLFILNIFPYWCEKK